MINHEQNNVNKNINIISIKKLSPQNSMKTYNDVIETDQNQNSYECMKKPELSNKIFIENDNNIYLSSELPLKNVSSKRNIKPK